MLLSDSCDLVASRRPEPDIRCVTPAYITVSLAGHSAEQDVHSVEMFSADAGSRAACVALEKVMVWCWKVFPVSQQKLNLSQLPSVLSEYKKPLCWSNDKPLNAFI